MAPRRILVTGAGGSPSTNFVRSLRESPETFHLIGADCNRYYLQRAETDERHLVPETSDPDYVAILRGLVEESGAELIYSQPDQEVLAISAHREEMGARTFLPAHRTIETCQDKLASFRCWKAAGLTVPETMLVRDEQDLEQAFAAFGAPVWLRAIVSPGGGKGSFRAESPRVARTWLDFCEGWGSFTAAECLEPGSITWTALYDDGELVVAQGRQRLYWEFGNRAPSGVTGITGTGVTVSDPVLDELALRAIQAIDPRPNGIFAVDLTYDRRGVPNPTEINIGRFFTTHLFFTRAGLNLPYLFVKLAFGEAYPAPARRLNPLPPGLAWVRGMDFLPVLTDVAAIEGAVDELAARRRRLPR
ncbi:MAG TPA: carboxylate--amine ligase [Thermoanaerobaculia bacterium]|jgi:carbamoyl-phosphate synthase large subunit|nr:carboxylate--amine ligase [Thermoanaerobaculia bacterium]